MKEQNTAAKPLGIPYDMMNFMAIREDNYYYVDKTRIIEKNATTAFQISDVSFLGKTYMHSAGRTTGKGEPESLSLGWNEWG